MKQVYFNGHLDEKDSIELARILFHVGSHLKGKLKPNQNVDFSQVNSFRINPYFPQSAQWIPILKCAFNWTRDFDNESILKVNSPHSIEKLSNILLFGIKQELANQHPQTKT